jgi:hypothetical protein
MFQSFLIMKVFSKYEEGLETAQDDTESGDGIFAESDRMEMEAAKVAKENKKRR